MSVKNEWPTANIDFSAVNQKSVIVFLCQAIFFGVHCIFTLFQAIARQSMRSHMCLRHPGTLLFPPPFPAWVSMPFEKNINSPFS
jgi:hypothetical protein